MTRTGRASVSERCLSGVGQSPDRSARSRRRDLAGGSDTDCRGASAPRVADPPPNGGAAGRLSPTIRVDAALVAQSVCARSSHSPALHEHRGDGAQARYLVLTNAGPGNDERPARRPKTRLWADVVLADRCKRCRQSGARTEVEPAPELDGRRRPTWRSVDCRSPGEQKSQDGDSGQLLGNANSHAHRHGHSCPTAPAMQHAGGAELTAALRR